MFFDEENHIYIAKSMYNFIDYSDNYSDILGSLWQFKRDEVPDKNDDLTIDNSQSFKYKTALVGKTADTAGVNTFLKNTKIVVSLMYLSNFWKSLEIPVIKSILN